MKKNLFLIPLFLICFVATVLASPPHIPSVGTVKTIRSAETISSTIPFVTDDSGVVTTTGYGNLRIIVDVTGTNPNFNIVPLYSDDTGSIWNAGAKINVTWDTGATIKTFGVNTMAMGIENIIDARGTSNFITIKVTPYND